MLAQLSYPLPLLWRLGLLIILMHNGRLTPGLVRHEDAQGVSGALHAPTQPIYPQAHCVGGGLRLMRDWSMAGPATAPGGRRTIGGRRIEPITG